MNSKKINKNLEYLKKTFSPFSKRVYLVGGCVRDEIINKTPNDTDLEVYDITPAKFTEIMKKLGAKGVGKKFFVYKWENFDISLPRTEIKISKGHKGFKVSLTQDEKTASKRRDFTMNALMKNIYTNQILDFWGGIRDIKNRIIRHIDDNTFVEDSLRVFRAMQFASRFKFKIAKETVKLCTKININDLPPERIYNEFKKMFKSDYLYYGFYYFIVLGIAKKLFQLTFKKQDFFYLSKIYKLNPLESYFFYHLKNYKHIKLEKITKALNMPNYLKREINTKKCPKIVTNRFLYALSLKYPLKLFSVLNNNCCKNWIKKNNLWIKKYKPKNINIQNPKISILQEIKNYDKIVIFKKKDVNGIYSFNNLR